MKKRMCTHIALCGLLSSSLVIFGSENPQTQPIDSTHPSHPAHHHHLGDLSKKIVADVEKIDTTMHPINQKILEEVKGNPQVVIAALQAVGVKPQDAQNITTTLEKGIGIGETVENKAHDLIQKHEAEKKSNQPVQTTATIVNNQ